MADVKDLLKQLRTKSAAAHKGATRQITNELTAKVNRDKGNLARSQRVTSTASETLFSSTVVYAPKTAEWTDKGTRPHIIIPKRGKVLRFEVGGNVVFARRVHHPGNRPFGWWTKTVTVSKWVSALKANYR